METVSASHPLFLREPITVHTHGAHCGYRALAARYRGMPTLRSALFCATHFWQVSSQFETAVTRLQTCELAKALAISSSPASLRRYRAEPFEGSRQVRARQAEQLLIRVTALRRAHSSQIFPPARSSQIFARPLFVEQNENFGLRKLTPLIRLRRS
jgi:hypothetical protein